MQLADHIKTSSAFIAKHSDTTPLHAKFFCHDMTFGNGAASVLSTNPDVPLYYQKNREALVHTNKQGRALEDGIYLSHYFLDANPDYTHLMKMYYQKFGFQQSLHIVKKESGRQHFYTFAFNCSLDNFTHLVVNNLHRYKQYIAQYHRKCHDLIERSCEHENQIELPFSDSNPSKNMRFLFSDEITKNSNIIDTFFDSINDINVENILSTQQIKCFHYLLRGMSAREIAIDMGLSHRTIEHYIAAIKSKLHCKNTKELIARFSTLGIKDSLN